MPKKRKRMKKQYNISNVSKKFCIFCSFTENKHYIRKTQKLLEQQTGIKMRKFGVCTLFKAEINQNTGTKKIPVCTGLKPYPKFCPLLKDRIDPDSKEYKDLITILFKKENRRQ